MAGKFKFQWKITIPFIRNFWRINCNLIACIMYMLKTSWIMDHHEDRSYNGSMVIRMPEKMSVFTEELPSNMNSNVDVIVFISSFHIWRFDGTSNLKFPAIQNPGIYICVTQYSLHAKNCYHGNIITMVTRQSHMYYIH